MEKPLMQLKNLKKKINGKWIIKGIRFDLYPGEVFGFLGPNGAGKTTTIRMMVGLTSITEGEVLIEGYSIAKDYEKAIAKVGAIVENPDMYKFLTGYKNLELFARMSPKVSKKRIDEVVKIVELEHAIHQKVSTYSLGMRQRLGLAQALLHRPSILILDEPTNGLDPAGIHDLRNYLRRLAKEEKMAILVSSHLLSEMEMMCDRIGIIQKGELIRVETVRDFIGKDEREKQVFFEVEPANIAKELIAKHFPQSKVEEVEKGVVLSISRSEIPAVSALLVSNQVQLFGIERRSKSLEEKFLEITHQ
jgi:ABC-2 type transport system ATP-binding protein